MSEDSGVSGAGQSSGGGGFFKGLAKSYIKKKVLQKKESDAFSAHEKPKISAKAFVTFLFIILIGFGAYQILYAGTQSGWTQRKFKPVADLYEDAIKPAFQASFRGIEETFKVIEEGPEKSFFTSDVKTSEKTGVELGSIDVVSGLNRGFIDDISPLRLRTKLEINKLDENLKNIRADLSCRMDSLIGEIKTGFPSKPLSSGEGVAVTYPNTGQAYTDAITCTFKETTSSEFQRTLKGFDTKKVNFELTYYMDNFAELDVKVIDPDSFLYLEPEERKEIRSIMKYKSDVDISLYFDSQPLPIEGISREGTSFDGITYLNLGVHNLKSDANLTIRNIILELPDGIRPDGNYNKFFRSLGNSRYGLLDSEIAKWNRALEKEDEKRISIPIKVLDTALGGSKVSGKPVVLKARLITGYAYSMAKTYDIDINFAKEEKELQPF